MKQYNIVSSRQYFLKLDFCSLTNSKAVFMGSFSPYSINEALPPKWRPGEDIAAGAFIGMALLLFVEVNVLIFRAFKKRQGLYFWSMQLGSLGILINTIGIILKLFTSLSIQRIWPLSIHAIYRGWMDNLCYGPELGTLFPTSSCNSEPENTTLCSAHDLVYYFHLHRSHLGRFVAGVQPFRS